MKTASFRLQEVWQNAQEPQGQVLRQYPEAGITVKERSLKVWVSKGPETLLVPDLIGKTPEEAQTILENLGFEYVKGADQRSEIIAEGLVAGQTPAPGTELAKGSRVEVNLSLGNKFVVEDFRNQPIDEVRARLEELGVDYEMVWVASELPKGTVVDQSPAPGETKPIGTFVHLQVSTGEPPVVEAP